MVTGGIPIVLAVKRRRVQTQYSCVNDVHEEHFILIIDWALPVRVADLLPCVSGCSPAATYCPPPLASSGRSLDSAWVRDQERERKERESERVLSQMPSHSFASLQ